MAKIAIPKNPGVFRVIIARAGNYLVTNDRGGKNGINIACASQAQADEICRKLNEGDHNGEIHAPNNAVK